MIDKKQMIGGAIGLVAILGYSVYSGKLDISQFTGGGADAEVTFERKLPPPVAENTEVQPGAPVQPGVVEDVPADDVLASLSGESSANDFVSELTGGQSVPAAVETAVPGDLAVESLDLAAAVAQPITLAASPAKPGAPVQPVAQLASTDPAKVMVGGAAFTQPPVVQPGQPLPTGENAPVPPGAPGAVAGPLLVAAPVGGLPASVNSVPPQNAAAAILPTAGVLPAGKAVSVPGTAVVAHVAGGVVAPAERVAAQVTPVALNSGAMLSGSGAYAAGQVASLPTNATGKDLLELQTQLTVLEKQKAIASGQEAIAESMLKMKKAQFEMTQIGQPTYEQLVAQAQAQANAQAQAVSATPPPPSPLFGVRLLSTQRANGTIGATITFNGKMIDVKKGSMVAGFLVDKVTDNSLTLIGEGETKTVWID